MVPSYNFIYVAFSPGAEANQVPLTQEVRQALALALDYDGIIEFTVGGEGKPQASPIPNGFPGTADLPMPVEDLEKAKELLAEAGLADGFELDVVVAALNVYGVDLPLLMQKVQQDLARVNVTTNIQPVASSVWREQIVRAGHSVHRPLLRAGLFRLGAVCAVLRHDRRRVLADERERRRGTVDLINPREAELLQEALATSDDAEREGDLSRDRAGDDQGPDHRPGRQPQPRARLSQQRRRRALQRLLQPAAGRDQPEIGAQPIRRRRRDGAMAGYIVRRLIAMPFLRARHRHDRVPAVPLTKGDPLTSIVGERQMSNEAVVAAARRRAGASIAPCRSTT